MQRLTASIGVLAMTVLLPISARADLIYYNSGETLKGLVVEEHRDRVIVSTEAGEWTVLRKEIAEIFYDEAERNFLYLGNQALGTGNFPLAHGFYKKALQLKPGFREAQDALERLVDLKKKQETPEREANPAEALQRRWGIRLEIQNDWPVIQSVKENSFAAHQGLMGQDILTAVWGESLVFLSLDDVAKTLLGPAGTRVRVTIQRAVALPKEGPGSGKKGWPGWTLNMELLGLTVASVELEGAAAETGLQAGDRIVEIQGRSTRYMPLEQAKRTVLDARKKGLTLMVQRDILIRRE